jgi:hypothetical protein
MKIEKYKKLAIEKSVHYASVDLNINQPNIVFKEKPQLPHGDISAMFLKEHYVIIFNSDWVEKAAIGELLITCFHETRHAYQWNRINDVDLNSSDEDSYELIQKWMIEFNEYIQPSCSGENNGYITQIIEIDAVDYANKTIRHLLGKTEYHT